MAEKEKQNKKKQQHISKAPSLIQNNGRVYLGCDRYNQRHEVCICDAHGCSKRRKCQQYTEAKEMQEDWKDLHGSSLIYLTPTNMSKKRKRRRKSEHPTNAPTINPTSKKRKRKVRQNEEHTNTKRKRKRKS